MSDEVKMHFEKIMEFINSPNRCDCPYYVIDRIEAYIAEQMLREVIENGKCEKM